MILTRSSGLLTLSILLLAAMPAAGASAKAKPKRPTVRSVAPLTASVGDQLTIKGKNFVLGKRRNSVFFKAGNRPAVSAKTVLSTRRMMKIIIPKSVEKYMTVQAGVLRPTKFRLRILSKRFGKRYTVLRLSPTIAPLPPAPPQPGSPPVLNPGAGPAADCDRDTIVDASDSDDDNDLLSDVVETGLKLGICDQDSDNDGMEDGFEYQSALDLNNTTTPPLPYPGKRPYPNPLDGSDAGTDYDGDGLSAGQEHQMWKAFGPRSLVLNYSAGMKRSVAGPFNDDNRDVDADDLGNWDEFNGRMTPEWWVAIVKDEKPYTESYHATSPIDGDSDGDLLNDGADDIDQDGWTNADELNRGPFRVQPFNPCLPDPYSPTCSEHPPLPDASYPPFDTASYAFYGSPLPLGPLVVLPPPPTP